MRLYVPYYNGGNSTGAANNPFTYRGYYYDHDLKMYYLQSRSYDPVICRFISPDDVSYLGANGDLIGYNLYAYCSNNPVMYCDHSGNSITAAIGITIFGALVGGAMGAFTALTTGGDIVESVALGAINGAITSAAALFCGKAAFAVAGLFTAGIDALEQGVLNGAENIDISRSIKTGVMSAVSAAVPAIGTAAGEIVDAIGTAVVWSEASALIAVADIICTNIFNMFFGGNS